MEQQHTKTSLMVGLPGLALEFYAVFAQVDWLVTVGAIMFMVGLGYYAKAKGYTGWWGLLGIFSIFGLIVLALLPNRNKQEGEKSPANKAAIGFALVFVVMIVGIAIFLLFAPGVPGPAKDKTDTFLQALVNEDYAVAYRQLSSRQKSNVGGPGGLETWIKQEGLQIKSWSPPTMSREINDGLTAVPVSATLVNGQQEEVVVILSGSGDDWEVELIDRLKK